MKRTFVAIEIAPNKKLLGAYNHFTKILQKENIKWIDPNLLHITIFFLGETLENQIISVMSVIESSVAEFRRFNIFLKGCWVFPSFSKPSVLWFGIEKSVELGMLNGLIGSSLEKEGFQSEKRQFMPHITFARIREIKEKSKLLYLVEVYQNTVFAQIEINKCVYFESKLTQSGPVYLKLKEISLK